MNAQVAAASVFITPRVRAFHLKFRLYIGILKLKVMKVLYARVSSIDQKTDRQRVNEQDFDLVIEDKCPSSIPFFDKVGNKVI